MKRTLLILSLNIIHMVLITSGAIKKPDTGSLCRAEATKPADQSAKKGPQPSNLAGRYRVRGPGGGIGGRLTKAADETDALSPIFLQG